MFFHEGSRCPVCEKPLTEQEDIVVCPACGAPHHRICWSGQGACFYQDKHGTEEEWCRPEKIHRPEKTTARCPACGAVNSAAESRCNACGVGMDRSEARIEPEKESESPESSEFSKGKPPFIPPDFPGQEVFDGQILQEDGFEDVPAKDAAKFIGPNGSYYFKKFNLISKFKKLGSFNFVALLFPGIWMLSRKMYRWGAVLTGIVGVLQLLSTFVSSKLALPLMEGLYKRAGIDIYGAEAFGMEASFRLAGELMKMSTGEIFLMFVPMLMTCVLLGIGIYMGVMGNKLYYNHCLSRIRSIRDKNQEPAVYEKELSRQGGVNPAIVLSVWISIYALNRLLAAYLAKGG